MRGHRLAASDLTHKMLPAVSEVAAIQATVNTSCAFISQLKESEEEGKAACVTKDEELMRRRDRGPSQPSGLGDAEAERERRLD